MLQHAEYGNNITQVHYFSCMCASANESQKAHQNKVQSTIKIIIIRLKNIFGMDRHAVAYAKRKKSLQDISLYSPGLASAASRRV